MDALPFGNPPRPKTATNVRCSGEPHRPGVSYDERCDHASFQRIQFRLHQQMNLKRLQGKTSGTQTHHRTDPARDLCDL